MRTNIGKLQVRLTRARPEPPNQSSASSTNAIVEENVVVPNRNDATGGGEIPARSVDEDEVIEVPDESFEIPRRGNEELELIDLTSLSDTESQSLDRRQRIEHVQPRGSTRNPIAASDNPATPSTSGRRDHSGDGDVVVIDHVVNPVSRKRKLVEGNNGPGSAPTENSELLLHCFVCLDEFQLIKREGTRRITATPCGHLFCSECIDQAIYKHGCCPACRKKLTSRSTRVIYM